MKYIEITNSDEQLRPHFKMSEFWNSKFSRHSDFNIPECLVDAQEIMRSFFNCPIIITSCSRPDDKFGFHRYLNETGAIDSVPSKSEYIATFRDECMKYQDGRGSTLIENLRKIGVEGFGIESGNCIHLDFRNGTVCLDKDKYGTYTVFSWDKTNGSRVFSRK